MTIDEVVAMADGGSGEGAGSASQADQDSGSASSAAGGTQEGGSSVEKTPGDDIPDMPLEQWLAEGSKDAGDTPAAGQKAAPAPAQDDARLEALAKDLGLSPEKVAKIKAAGLAEDFFGASDRKIVADAMAAKQGQQTPPQTPATPAQPETPPRQEQQPPQKPAEISYDWKDEFGDEVPETSPLRKNLSALEGHIRGQFGSLRGDIAEVFKQVVMPMREDFGRMANLLAQERVERMIANLGPEWKETFGEGDLDDLDPAGPAAANRAKLVDAAAAIIHWEHSKGREVKLNSQTFKRALAAAFSEQLQSKARRAVSAETQKAKQMRTAPPTQRRSTDHLTSEEQAFAAAAEGFAKYGLRDDDA